MTEAGADTGAQREQAPGRASGPPRVGIRTVKLTQAAAWSVRLLLIGAGLLGLWYVLGWLWVIVLPVLLALLVTSVLWPLTRVLRRFLPPALATFATLVAAFAVLAGLVAWLAPQVAGQWQELVDAVSSGLEELQVFLTRPPFNLEGQQIANAVDQAVSAVQDNADVVARGVLSSAASVGSALVTATLAVVLSFFFLKDGPRFLPWLSGVVGPYSAPHVTEMCRRSWGTLSGFVLAQAAVGLVDAVAIGIGLVILDVPLALPLAVLIFFGAFVPLVGATVTGALAALVALVSNGLVNALIVVAVVVLVQQLEGDVLQPVLMSRTLSLHPAVVLLSVTAGGSLFGIVGAFLAVPVVAVATAVLGYVREQFDQAPEAAVEQT